ncbi:beta-1,6-N-acetylglucosaminyltransferase [Pedobacter sp. KACC 23697]|uniref:Peptide O-xylosyltransferase n=1 Tax=Pedobacter sp. KACC 23697 TaxID=3149230 RepID=A0AAU7K981_9SPHI
MNLTYVILAHDDPKNLERLVSCLSAENVKFVVHIDIRAELSTFTNRFTALDLVNITFIKKRCESYWGSFAIVQATLNCLKAVCDKLPFTDRIVVMSGHDYPIKNNRYIYEYLKSNPLSIYLTFNKIPYRIWWKGGKERFPSYEKINEVLKIYAGSQWFSLPKYALKIIFDFIKLNPDFVRYFQTVDIPDESFFQTLFLNCGEKIIEDNLINQGLHLIKWDSPYTHPRYLNEQHFALIKRSSFLFARKFNAESPSKILDKIDINLLYQKGKCYKNIENKLVVNEAQQKCAVLFLTNKSDRTTLSVYQKLKREAPDRHEVFLMYHQTRKVISKSISIQNPIPFTDNILRSTGFNAINNKLTPGSNHFPLFDYYQQNQGYDYYWYIEDDVRFNGDWSVFFDSFKQDSTDFLTCHVRRYQDEPNWFWWETLKHNSGIRIPLNFRLRSFNPIFRISKRALAFLNNAFKTGWSGHHEVTMVSLLFSAGFSIADLGDRGEFVSSMVTKTHYKSALPDLHGNVSTGSMRFRPTIEAIEMTDEILYHPVKTVNSKKTDWQNSYHK